MRASFIYIIGVTENPVKVGIANDVERRLCSLQIGCPDTLIVHHKFPLPAHLVQWVETKCHQALADKHRRGEWFNVTADEAKAVVEQIAARAIESNAFHAERRGDLIDILASRFHLDATARMVLQRHNITCKTEGREKIAARAHGYVLRTAGHISHAAFQMFVIEDKSPVLLLEGDRKAQDNAYRSLVKAINALCDWYNVEQHQAA